LPKAALLKIRVNFHPFDFSSVGVGTSESTHRHNSPKDKTHPPNCANIAGSAKELKQILLVFHRDTNPFIKTR
jgi:hypothetical protein